MIKEAKVIHIKTGQECEVIEVIFDRIAPWIIIKHNETTTASMSYPRFAEEYRK